MPLSVTLTFYQGDMICKKTKVGVGMYQPRTRTSVQSKLLNEFSIGDIFVCSLVFKDLDNFRNYIINMNIILEAPTFSNVSTKFKPDMTGSI